MHLTPLEFIYHLKGIGFFLWLKRLGLTIFKPLTFSFLAN
jgi:hypothetical protein